TALVFIRRRSVPQCGSVRHIVPAHSPLIILVAMFSFIHGWPVPSSAPEAAPVRPGYIAKAWLADCIISPTARLIIIGISAPPNLDGAASAPQPASQNCL